MKGCASSGFDMGSAFVPLDGTIGILRRTRNIFSPCDLSESWGLIARSRYGTDQPNIGPHRP
jgi:hypothetical protein